MRAVGHILCSVLGWEVVGAGLRNLGVRFEKILPDFGPDGLEQVPNISEEREVPPERVGGLPHVVDPDLPVT